MDGFEGKRLAREKQNQAFLTEIAGNIANILGPMWLRIHFPAKIIGIGGGSGDGSGAAVAAAVASAMSRIFSHISLHIQIHKHKTSSFFALARFLLFFSSRLSFSFR